MLLSLKTSKHTDADAGQKHRFYTTKLEIVTRSTAKRRDGGEDGPRTRVLSTNERTHSVVGEASRRDTESLHNHESDLRNAQGKEKKSIR